MSSSETKLVTPVSLAIDLVLVAGFFAFIFSILRSHVPSADPKIINLFAGLTASCMSGVFWLAIQMFRVVRTAHKARDAKK
jgi:hypothetical protein